MKIQSVRIKNFLTFDENGVEINDLSTLTFLVGPNQSGKSSFIKAIEFVSRNYNRDYNAPIYALKSYFHNQDSSREIEISLKVSLNPVERRIVLTALLLALEIDAEPDVLQNKTGKDRKLATETIHEVIRRCSTLFGPLLENDVWLNLKVMPGSQREVYTYIGFTTPSGLLYLADGSRLSMSPGPSNVWGSLDFVNEIYDRLIAKNPDFFSINSDQSEATDEIASEVANSFDIDWFTENLTDVRSVPRSLYLHWIELGRPNKYWKVPLEIEDLLELEEYLTAHNTASNRPQTSLHDIVFSMLDSSVAYLSDERTKLSSMGMSHPWIKSNGEELELTNDLPFNLFKMSNSVDKNSRNRYRRILEVEYKLAGVHADVVLEAKEIRKGNGESETIKIEVPALVFDEESISYPATLAASGHCELLSVLYAVYGPSGTSILLDEPALNLHPVKQRELMDTILALAQEADNNLIIVTHSPALVKKDYIDASLRFTFKNGATVVNRLDLKENAEKLRKLILMDPSVLNALFAKKVLLLEGGQELLALPEWFSKLEDWLDLDVYGIVLLDVHGSGQFGNYAQLLESWDIQFRLIGDSKSTKELKKYGDRARMYPFEDFSHLLKKYYLDDFEKAKKFLNARSEHDPMIARIVARDNAPPDEMKELWEWLRPFVDEI